MNAIKLAGGITENADLKNIQTNRILPFNESNKYIKEYKLLNFKLSDLYKNGDQSQNPLFDEDIITINKSKVKDANIDRVSMANLAPDQISVSFIGEVFNPGTKLISPNTSLVQGICFRWSHLYAIK